MPIPVNRARETIDSYRTDRIANLFAQSDARRVLYEVGESEENFPRFDPAIVDKVTMSAYSILAAGVSLAETEITQEAIDAMEEAASLLNNVHAPHAETDRTSSFHVLIASMAFHTSGQYFRAFVSIRNVEALTDLARMIAAYIRKRPNDVVAAVNPYVLADLDGFTDPRDLGDHSVTLSIARALSLALEYFATGNQGHIDAAIGNLNIALELAHDFESPSHWWVARLLRLMINGNRDASLRSMLPPCFPGDLSLLERYSRLLAFGKHPITELWRSQREAIPVVMDRTRSGAIVNMRISSGKTRIAELAILQTVHDDPTVKILYLAPFRSLALEIEQSLGQIFDWCGFHVSHLYGGFRLSPADRKLAEESSITIATPEKARAILRSSPELLADVKLIIIDEGHLIGADERYVKNELFVDHLRTLTRSTGCRQILLSAVLPNAGDLSTWLTGASENVARSTWKLSSERFGLLRWQGNRVRIDWRGEFESFNPSFVQSGRLGWGRRRKPFPDNKNEAVVATAVKLSTIGPVMIFSARANSIPGLAKAVLMALGEMPGDYDWPEKECNAFLATCEEELPDGVVEVRAARHGVICHSNRLPSQVRLATERLMRSVAPRIIIIASSTLAQGVNVGVSSVIVSTPYQTSRPIDHRDYWNICGRAGRAFVDGEGKILYAIDETREQWQVNKDRELSNGYFDRSKSDPVESSLLFVLGRMKEVAQQAEIDFYQLVTMVAEDDFSTLGEEIAPAYQGIMDLIDDGLLALHADSIINPKGDGPEVWVDKVFRTSLASLQADGSRFSITPDQVVRFVTARAKRTLQVAADQEQRRAYIASGLPVSAASNVYRDREQFCQTAQALFDADLSLESVIASLEWLEEWSRTSATGVIDNLPAKDVLDQVRAAWINGDPMREILEKTTDADSICKDAYGFQLPWLIHAASQQIKLMGKEDLFETLSSVALLVELGLPSENAAWIFLAGVRSRASATELAACGIDLGSSLSEIRRNLSDPDTIAALRDLVSERTKASYRYPHLSGTGTAPGRTR
jgi:hypothetical protein